MAYFIELHERDVQPYLEDSGPLSSAIRAILKRHLADLGAHGDTFRNDPDCRIPGSPFFRFDVLLRDPDTNRLRGFYFVVSDESAPYGVLQVVYVDERGN
ncbi:MAG: hypothetical protein ACRELG_25165 [Gemmataceae bacterium]